MPSIRRRLLSNLLLAGTLLCVLTATTVTVLVRSEVGELLDYLLEQVARTLIDRDLSEIGTVRPEDPATHLEIQLSDAAGRLLYASDPGLGLPLATPLGLTTIDDPSGTYDDGLRVFTLRSASRTVQVFQPMSLREELAWDAGLAALIPAVLLLIALSGLIVLTIRRELQPLQRLGEELETRGRDALAPIELPDAPSELQAPVLTLNRLLGRLDEAMRAHRDFVADAAHELRSPLTAIRLQAGNVAAAQDEAQRRAAIEQLTRGVDRASHLVAQLLTLARLEPSARVEVRERIDLRDLAQRCLVDQVGAASAREIQLGLSGNGPAWVDGDGEALHAMLDNLVGNAIKYAPRGSAVEVSVGIDGGDVLLALRDQGPGIAPEERERVFGRFHRLAKAGVPGSGLGLAIVAAVVRAHGGYVRLGDPPVGSGLVVEVRLPVPTG
jgi:two-component system OmpR family sensor kinase